MSDDTILSRLTNIIDHQIAIDWGGRNKLVKDYLLVLKNHLIQEAEDAKKADGSKLTNAFEILVGWHKSQINKKGEALKLLHPSSLMAWELEGQISALETSMIKAREILQECQG